jgi:hypothetical protein
MTVIVRCAVSLLLTLLSPQHLRILTTPSFLVLKFHKTFSLFPKNILFRIVQKLIYCNVDIMASHNFILIGQFIDICIVISYIPVQNIMFDIPKRDRNKPKLTRICEREGYNPFLLC